MVYRLFIQTRTSRTGGRECRHGWRLSQMLLGDSIFVQCQTALCFGVPAIFLFCYRTFSDDAEHDNQWIFFAYSRYCRRGRSLGTCRHQSREEESAHWATHQVERLCYRDGRYAFWKASESSFKMSTTSIQTLHREQQLLEEQHGGSFRDNGLGTHQMGYRHVLDVTTFIKTVCDHSNASQCLHICL